jgi:hypothetical protein
MFVSGAHTPFFNSARLTLCSTLSRMLVEAGCVTFDDLPPVTRLEYSIDHADVYLSEDAA